MALIRIVACRSGTAVPFLFPTIFFLGSAVWRARRPIWEFPYPSLSDINFQTRCPSLLSSPPLRCILSVVDWQEDFYVCPYKLQFFSIFLLFPPFVRPCFVCLPPRPSTDPAKHVLHGAAWWRGKMTVFLKSPLALASCLALRMVRSPGVDLIFLFDCVGFNYPGGRHFFEPLVFSATSLYFISYRKFG